MNKQAIQKLSFCTLFLALFAIQLLAQPVVIQRCTTISPIYSTAETMNSIMSNVSFDLSAYPNHVISDVKVSVKWSKGQGSCGAINTALPTDLSEVGFTLYAGTATQFLGLSAFNALMLSSSGNPLNSIFTGNTAVSGITTNFVSNGGINQNPPAAPINNGNYATNSNSTNNFSTIIGQNASSFHNIPWNLAVTDDAPNNTGVLCIEEFCVTISLCESSSFTAVCNTTSASILIDSSGIGLPTFATINGGSDTACGLKSVTFTSAGSAITPFNCADIGRTVPVEMILTSHLNQVRTCTTTAIIRDNIAPTITCSPLSVYLTTLTNGSAVINASVVNGSDNCGNITKHIVMPNNTLATSRTYFCSHLLGINDIVFQVTDNSGNIARCTSALTVLDTIPPVARCQSNLTVHLDNTGGRTLVYNDILSTSPASSDNCGITGYTINGGASVYYNCDSIGTRTALLIARDAANNLDTCSTTITVRDTIRPTAICQNTTVYLNASGTASVTPAMINNGSSDNCTSSANLLFRINSNNSVSFNCNDITSPTNSARVATLTVVDAQNNAQTCTANITILDTIAPTPLCNSFVSVYADATGSATVTPTLLNNNSRDNCTPNSNLTFSLTTASLPSITLNCLNNTQQVIRLNVSDANGNSSFCETQVNLLDTIAPTALCINSIDIYTDATGSVTLTPLAIDNNSSDNCNIVIRNINNNTSTTYTCADIGLPQTAVLYIEDAAGNFNECNTTVNVLDTIAPIANCQDINVLVNNNGSVRVYAEDINNVVTPSSDNCGTVQLSINTINTSYIDFTNCPLGANNVVLIVTDDQGLTNTCNATINIADNIAPTAHCRPITAALSSTGSITTNATQIRDASSRDNCAITTTLFESTGTTSRTFDCSHIGPNTAILRLTDRSGNIGRCTTTITVVDNTAPIARCRQNLPVQLNATGVAVVTPQMINTTSSDNCAITSFKINNLDSVTYTCAQIGTTQTATLTVRDAAGLSHTCATSIIVEDRIAPTPICHSTMNVDLPNVPNAAVTIAAVDLDNGSTDNCNNLSFSINGSSNISFDCDDLGLNLVTLTVSDGTNTDICITEITVRDLSAPIADCNTAINAQVDNSGVATITANQVNRNSIDNCPNITFSLSDSIFQCTPSTQVVTLTVSDNAGNTSTCTSTISIIDNIVPTITTCTPSTTLNLDATGNASINASTLATAIDNCGTPTLSINNNASIAFTCVDAGRTLPITIVATDASGNISTCNSNITIQDITPPTANCNNPTVYLNSTGIATLTTTEVNNNSIDNCGINTLALNNTNFDCSNLTTTNTVVLTVTDVNGLTAVCNATVTVLDTIRPTANCNNPTVYLDATGVANITPAMINNNSIDNCGIAFSSINSSQNIIYTCTNITTTNNITYLVRDASGNENTCTSTVTVLDNIAPIITCNTIPVSLNSVGQVTVNVSELATTNDNCSSTLSLATGNTITFDCTNVGANSVVVTASDASGNSSTCSATVNIIDDVRPTAICRTNTIYLSSIGTTTIDPILIDNGSNDACGIASMVISPATVDCQTLATNTTPLVTLTVTDVNGNVSACSVSITLQDTTAPTAICAPFNAYLNATGTVSVLATNINNGSNDICGLDSTSFRINNANQVNYSCADLGAQPVTLTVSDIYNNTASCQTTVNVIDTIRPIANCFTQITAQLDNTGNAVVTPSMLNNASTDLCGLNTAAFLVNGQTSITYSCNQINTTQTATLTVVDNSGNTSTCQSAITITDTIAPIANCVTTPIHLNLNAISGQVSLNATALNNGSTDNCNSIASYLMNGQTRTTFNCNDVGSNIITLTVTDNNGNSSTCQSEVIIHDNTAPVAHCQPTLQLYLPNVPAASITINALDIDNGSSDNCGINSYLINGQPSLSFDCSQINTPTAVVLTVTDLEGNSALCNSIVTIRDTVSPVALCTPGTVNASLDASGIVTVTPAMINMGSYDNCGITDITINNARQIIYTCADLGTHTITLRVRDANGLESTCTSEVLVEDNIAPLANCYQTITVYLDQTGQVTVNATALDSASVDACLPITRNINGAASISFDCQYVGSNPTTLTIYDASNNMASCVTNIIVRDTTPARAICSNINAALDANGEVRVTAQTVANNSIDNCGINSYSFATGRDILYSCNDIGTHAVTVTVTDVYNNTSTCTANISVVDTSAPTIVCRPTASFNLTTTTVGYITSNLIVVNGSITDNCDVNTLTFSRDSVTCIDANTVIPVTVTVSDMSGNTASCVSEITVTLDHPTITSANEVCADETLSLQATLPSGAINYNVSWSGPNGFTANTATASIPNIDASYAGNYIITITPTTSGCPASDTINVIVHTVATPVVTAINPTCENDEVRLSINNLTDYTQHSTLSFEWFKAGVSLGQTDSILIISNATMADAGIYTVIVTADNCPKTSADFTVDIMSLPTAPLLSSNTPCEMDNLVLEGITDTVRTYSYAWSGPDNFTSTVPNPIITDANQNNAGLYSLIITDQYGCTATNDISVSISPKPQAPSLFYNTPLCADDLLEITDTNTYVIAPLAYNWTLADASTASTTIPQLVVTTPVVGTYSLVVNMDGCFSDTSTISVDYQPSVIAIDDNIELEFRDSVSNFSVAANDATNAAYSVSIIQMPRKGNVSINTDGTLNYIAGYSAFGRDTITYTICDVNCPDNCDTAQVFITIVADFECYIPEAISPNGDGFNDIWNISCINEYPNREVSVFSRWGELIYKGDGSTFDGKYKGNDLPDGTYFYILKLNDTTHVPNDTFKGHLIIRR